MTIHRRRFLHTAMGVAASILFVPLQVLAARPKQAFGADKMDDAMKSMFGTTTTDSSHVTLKAPHIAENGAVEPITETTDLKDAESVTIMVQNNPNPLAASFALTPSSGGMVSTRIKMAKTSPVVVMVKSGGKVYSASKEVKVTIGGCGG